MRADSDSKPSRDEWKTIVRNVYLVSIDLVIKHNDGILLGNRENGIAKREDLFRETSSGIIND